MTDPILVQIGGELVTVPAVLNFATLERVWPSVVASASAKSTIERHAACIAFLAAILVETRPDLNVPEIKKRLRVNIVAGTDERPGVIAAVDAVLEASGLVPKGEAAPPEAPAADPAP